MCSAVADKIASNTGDVLNLRLLVAHSPKVCVVPSAVARGIPSAMGSRPESSASIWR